MFLTTETDGSIVIVEGSGEVAEWLKAPVSKTGICIRISRVRIPPSSPNNRRCWPVAGRYRRLVHPLAGPAFCSRGEVPERLNGHAWKACVGASSPQVRILSSPPFLRFFVLAPGVALAPGVVVRLGRASQSPPLTPPIRGRTNCSVRDHLVTACLRRGP